MADVETKAEVGEDSHMLSDAEITRRGMAALADRRARGEIMTYDLDGWVVREFPGQRIVRLCRSKDFRAEDYPYPDAACRD